MSDVSQFPKSQRLRTVSEALADAAAENFDHVLIIGVSNDGTHTMITSQMLASTANWHLDRAKQMLLGHRSDDKS